ncbi:MAG: M48 family metalloprotease [Pseudomonadales bacterium]
MRHSTSPTPQNCTTTTITRLALCLSLLWISVGCATNPVTGKSELSVISESWELKTGKQQYQPMRQSQGGDYLADPEVQNYVREVGNKLAAVSDRNLPYEFHVVNDGTPNAWALPGGKIAIHRGLLTELKSEAELAAVLGHEIVHAAAKHGAKSVQRGVLLQSTVALAGVATKDSDYAKYAELGAGLGAALISTKYGRDAERESDLYGMNYMHRAGYDPMGAVDLQQTFVNLSKDRKSNKLGELFASHPPSQERVEANRRHAATLPKGGVRGAARYQQIMRRLNETKSGYEAYDKATKAFADANFGEARRLANKALSIEPNEARFHSLLGDIANVDDRLPGAQRHYRNAIRLNDSFFYPYLQSGLVSRDLGELTAAKRSLNRSVELLPTATAYNALGDIAETEGNLPEAKEYYAAASKDPGSAGQTALTALIKLNVAERPDAYIDTAVGLASNGEWVIAMRNNAPRAFTDIELELLYRANDGRVQRRQITLSGTLAAQSTRQTRTGLDATSATSPQVRVRRVTLAASLPTT